MQSHSDSTLSIRSQLLCCADQAWTLQKLLTKTKTELADILKKSGQKITGKKEELMARVLSSQKQ